MCLEASRLWPATPPSLPAQCPLTLCPSDLTKVHCPGHTLTQAPSMAPGACRRQHDLIVMQAQGARRPPFLELPFPSACTPPSSDPRGGAALGPMNKIPRYFWTSVGMDIDPHLLPMPQGSLFSKGHLTPQPGLSVGATKSMSTPVVLLQITNHPAIPPERVPQQQPLQRGPERQKIATHLSALGGCSQRGSRWRGSVGTWLQTVRWRPPGATLGRHCSL